MPRSYQTARRASRWPRIAVAVCLPFNPSKILYTTLIFCEIQCGRCRIRKTRCPGQLADGSGCSKCTLAGVPCVVARIKCEPQELILNHHDQQQLEVTETAPLYLPPTGANPTNLPSQASVYSSVYPQLDPLFDPSTNYPVNSLVNYSVCPSVDSLIHPPVNFLNSPVNLSANYSVNSSINPSVHPPAYSSDSLFYPQHDARVNAPFHRPIFPPVNRAFDNLQLPNPLGNNNFSPPPKNRFLLPLPVTPDNSPTSLTNHPSLEPSAWDSRVGYQRSGF